MDELLNIVKDALEIGLIWSLLALGIFIAFRVLEFADLTAEGAVTMGGAVAASLILKGAPPFIATLLSVAGGFLAGIVTGILHTKLKIPAILSGILTMTGLYSVNLRILGKSAVHLGDAATIYTFPRGIIENAFVAETLTTFLVVVIIFFVLYWFFGTEIGMSIRATGMNKKMARAQGINTDIMIIFGLALANALVALCGALHAQSANSANMDVGTGTIVIGLAAIILGEILFGKRSFKNWLISVILGSVAYEVLVGVAIALGLNPNDLKLLQAILIAFILALPLVKKIRAAKQRRKEGAYNRA